MIQKNTQIIAITATIFFLLSVLASWMFIREVEQKKGVYASAILLESEMNHRERSLNEITEKLEDTKTERESLKTRILKEEDFIDFLALIEALGDEQGVELTTNSLSESEINNEFDELIMRVNLVGPYDPVMHTIAIFEHMPYQSSINEMSLIQTSDGKWNALFEFRLAKYKPIP